MMLSYRFAFALLGIYHSSMPQDISQWTIRYAQHNNGLWHIPVIKCTSQSKTTAISFIYCANAFTHTHTLCLSLSHRSHSLIRQYYQMTHSDVIMILFSVAAEFWLELRGFIRKSIESFTLHSHARTHFDSLCSCRQATFVLQHFVSLSIL